MSSGLIHSRCKLTGRAPPKALQVLDKLAAARKFLNAPQQTSLEVRLNSSLSSLTRPRPGTLRRE